MINALKTAGFRQATGLLGSAFLAHGSLFVTQQLLLKRFPCTRLENPEEFFWLLQELDEVRLVGVFGVVQSRLVAGGSS